MKRKISYILIGVLTFLIAKVPVNAGSLSIWSSSSTVTVGSSVTVSISASNLAGKFSVTSSNSSVLSGGTSSEWFESNTYSYTFTAKSAGSATVAATALDVAHVDTEGNFTGSKSVTINVVNPSSGGTSGSSGGSSSGRTSGGTTADKKNYSSDNYLKALGVTDFTLSPKFAKDTLEYSVELDADVTEIEVSATANDDKASVKGAGKIKVAEGANKIEIVVTAENGNEKKYIINATVKDKNPIEITIGKKKYTVIKREGVLEAPEGFEKTTVKIKNTDVLAYYNKTLKITLVGLKDSKGKANFYIYDVKKNTFTLYSELSFATIKLNILPMDKDLLPKGYKKYSLKLDGKNVEAYKLNKDSNYYLVYALNLTTGKKNLYLYDKKENTVQKYTDEAASYYQKLSNNYFYWIIGLASFIGAGVITGTTILIVRKVKNNGPAKVKKTKRGLR